MSDTRDRIEAADKIREEADRYRRNEMTYGYVARIDTGDIPGVFQDLCTFVGLKGYIRCDSMFDRLAELVDPTCEMIEIDDFQPSHKFKRWTCSKCGAVNFSPFGAKRVAYCNWCGSRAKFV